MKAHLFLLFGFAIAFVSCGEQQTVNVPDSIPTPDSIPHMVRVGKKAGWAYKPDTMINEILLGDVASLKAFMHANGSKGSVNGNKAEMYYFNGGETEYLTVFALVIGSKSVPYGLRLEKNSDTTRNYKREHNYVVQSNFITSTGIYIGMSVDFVQSMYKSQEMLLWVQGDTTFLDYTPAEKDKEHYRRYLPSDYHARYKFVNDKCRVIEMMVDPKSFEK